MPTYSCGCVNEVHEKSGVLASVLKCEFHVDYSRTHPQGDSIDYFKAMGCINERGIPQNKLLIDQLWGALLPDDFMYLFHGEGKHVLELGPGLGPYIPFFLQYHWKYDSVEMAPFACDWIESTFGYSPIRTTAEGFFLWDDSDYQCIFAAHLFEHVVNAPKLLKQCFDRLNERLVLIVPDDSDPTNPDHLWFFTQETLHALLEKIGFKNVRSQIRKHVPQENFIYCVAEK
jgi:methyltransferase family protein